MRTVVSGVDQDQQSAQVLRRALVEARTTGRPLEVLHAWTIPTWPSAALVLDDGKASREGQQRAVQVAADLLEETQSAIDAPVQSSVAGVYGDAGDLLVRASADAGLVVVGARRHGPLLSAVLGSATGYVLHHASCPVMVVPAGSVPGPFRRVVVGFDDVAHAGSALRWALDAARRHGCPLLVVHALRLTPFPVRMAAQVTDARRENHARAWLDQFVAGVTGEQPEVAVSTSVRSGIPHEVLRRAATAQDLLVVGSRASGGVTDVVLGEVAAQCARDGLGTVVLVRDGQERLDDTDAAREREELLTTGSA